MEGYAATIGMFDGVHRGHQFVLSQLQALARERGLQPMVVTFDHSLRPEPVLTPLAAKLSLLAATGVARVEVLPFSAGLKRMTARRFMQEVLKEQLHVRLLLTGYDNRFGHRREEGFDDYVRYGRELDMEVCRLPVAPSAGGQAAASSTLVRQFLSAGQVADAAALLGRAYTLAGTVGHGEHIGTGLGFPTANLVPAEAQQLVPAAGVYAVRVTIAGEPGGAPLPAMMNIGMRPTFGGHCQTLEIHLLHFHGNLYGRQLEVAFVGRLRSEQRFAGAAALAAQLRRDAEEAEKLLQL